MQFLRKKHPLSIWAIVAALLLSTSVFAQRDTIYIVDKRAEFVGGTKAFNEYWQAAFKVPLKHFFRGLIGEGVVSFTIDTMGRARSPFIKQALHPELDQAALRAVETMPLWMPAMRDGEKVSMGYEITYFTPDMGQLLPLNLIDTLTNKSGYFCGIWMGLMPQLGDFRTYLNPFRVNLGLTLGGYQFTRWQVLLEYDITFSKVKKPFIFKNLPVTTDMRGSSYNFYLPISYAVLQREKWVFRPYIAPTLNHFEIEQLVQKGDYQQYETLEEATNFSLSFGVCADRTLSFRRIRKRNLIYRYEKTFLRTRLNINPMSFSTDASTPLRGTVVSLTVGAFGQFLGRKK